ncbi:PIN-like domain-containing protein [Phascolarctobacterium sp.]|uniref:PIN-like domain-containing protein n=1 Tax=Phascolarctobacterium sp. TaxID=2049039 RepID=UPI00302DB6D6
MTEKIIEDYSDKKIDLIELLKEKYVIVCDTNVYLGLYRFSPDYANFALECLRAIEDYLLFPMTVKVEYSRHRNNLFQIRRNAIANISFELHELIKIQKEKLRNKCDTLKTFPKSEALLKDIAGSYDKLEEKIDEYFRKHSILEVIRDEWSEDIVERFVNKCIERGHIMEGFSHEEIYKLCIEADRRYKREIPPGFKDVKNKDGIRQYSDFILWEEIIKYVRNNGKNIIFVTDDIKADWWDTKVDPVEFLPALLDEFRKRTCRNKINFEIRAFNSKDFFAAVSGNFGIVKSEAIDQALKITSQDYIAAIKDRVFDSITILLAYSGTDYVDPSILTHIGDEGVEEWEIDSYEVNEYSILDRLDNEILYEIVYAVEMCGKSYDYYGKDEDTRNIILSPPYKHSVSGLIKVEFWRNVSMSMDLEDSYEFNDSKIVEVDLEEVGYSSCYDDE